LTTPLQLTFGPGSKKKTAVADFTFYDERGVKLYSDTKTVKVD